MSTKQIKGNCEHCGFRYQGKVPDPFPLIKCPYCGKETENFNYAYEVEEHDKAIGLTLPYIESELEITEYYEDTKRKIDELSQSDMLNPEVKNHG